MWCTAGGLGGEASSEAEIVPRVRGARTGCTTELGRGLSAFWAYGEAGEDVGVVGELEKLHGIQMQSNDGVTIIGGFGYFFLSRIIVE